MTSSTLCQIGILDCEFHFRCSLFTPRRRKLQMFTPNNSASHTSRIATDTAHGGSASLAEIKREKDLIRAEMERVVASMQRCEVELDNEVPGKREELGALRDQLTTLRARMKQVMVSSSVGGGGVVASTSSFSTPVQENRSSVPPPPPQAQQTPPLGGGNNNSSIMSRYAAHSATQQHTPREIRSTPKTPTGSSSAPTPGGGPHVPTSTHTSVPVHRYPQQQPEAQQRSSVTYAQPAHPSVASPPPAQTIKLSPARPGRSEASSIQASSFSVQQSYSQSQQQGVPPSAPQPHEQYSSSFNSVPAPVTNATMTGSNSKFVSPPKSRRGSSPPGLPLGTAVAPSSQFSISSTSTPNALPSQQHQQRSFSGGGGGPLHHPSPYQQQNPPETRGVSPPNPNSSLHNISVAPPLPTTTMGGGLSATEHHLLGQLRQRHSQQAQSLREEFERQQAAMDRRHAEEVRQCNDACLAEERVRREFEESRMKMEQAQRLLERMGQQHQQAGTRPAPEVSAFSVLGSHPQ